MAKPKKYAKAVVPTLDEALEISDDLKKELETEIKESFGFDDFIESHRTAQEILEETDKHLDEYVAAYEKNKNDREPVEKVYAFKIGILNGMAKRFHPLSEYGKAKLGEAVKCRMEFEALIGPMITRITKNNIDLFRTVLSRDVAEDIASGRLSAIGAVRTKKGTAYGVGALAYYFDEIGTEKVVRIIWLFVNKDFRERGVCNQLIGELTYRCAQTEFFNISVEFPIGITDTKLLGYVLGTWQFDLDSGMDPDSVMRVGDVTGYEKIDSYKKGVQALSAHDKNGSDLIVKKALRKLAYRGFLTNLDPTKDYIDRSLSCYFGEEDAVKAILLAHKTPSGILRVEYLGAEEGCEALYYNLISFFMEKAITSYEDDTLLKIPVEMEELGSFIEEICPKQMGQYMIAGNMTKPEPELDLSPEDVAKIMTV